MYTIPFYKINPSGNMTVLFEGTHFSQEEQLFFTQQAISSQHLHCEQVGFVDTAKGILRMAGGEFCVNATRSLGLTMALQATQHNLSHEWKGQVLTSGMQEPLTVEVKKPEIDTLRYGYDVTLHIPVPTLPPMQEVSKGLVLVTLDGISHLLIDAEIYPFCAETWQESARAFRQQLGIDHLPAVGCIWWSPIVNQHSQHKVCKMRMHPVVRIQHPYTECYENSCGSGTLALGLWLLKTTPQRICFVQQPGGYLSLEFQEHGYMRYALLGGPVHMCAQGQAFFAKPVTPL